MKEKKNGKAKLSRQVANVNILMDLFVRGSLDLKILWCTENEVGLTGEAATTSAPPAFRYVSEWLIVAFIFNREGVIREGRERRSLTPTFE